MSGEFEKQSGWTIDTLKELLERQTDAVKTSLQVFVSTVADNFVKTNEFRASLEDLSKHMATRREMESSMSAINDILKEQAKQLGELRSRIDIGNPAIMNLQRGADIMSGRSQGLSLGWSILIAMIGVIGAILGIVGYFTK